MLDRLEAVVCIQGITITRSVHNGHSQFDALLNDVQLLLFDGQRSILETISGWNDPLFVQIGQKE